MSVIYVDKLERAPKVPHWAIFKFFSVSQTLYTPDDSSVEGAHYEAYLTEKEWLAEIEHITARDPHVRFLAAKVLPAKVTLTLKTDVRVE